VPAPAVISHLALLALLNIPLSSPIAQTSAKLAPASSTSDAAGSSPSHDAATIQSAAMASAYGMPHSAYGALLSQAMSGPLTSSDLPATMPTSTAASAHAAPPLAFLDAPFRTDLVSLSYRGGSASDAFGELNN
jgi:hypothetical protein